MVLAIAILIAFAIWNEKWLLWSAIILLIGAASNSRVNFIIAQYWLKLSKLLGEINSKILLSIVFFIILTPVAFLYRIFNKGDSEHFKKNKKNSYFAIVDRTINKKYFTKQW